ncbi:MAG: branched-chain amino acid ABC transporter ATP-binding protein/permease [Geminicoccaceae bacterium]|nr:branched-chain amino acid ABC transporter ATP-binding protein/permease [Geminicoccaceae bacterium]
MSAEAVVLPASREVAALAPSRVRPLLVAAVALVLLPLAMSALGLTLGNAAVLVILAMAAMGLNILVGWTGLVSFGHAAWFGLGAYLAALVQLHLWPGDVLVPVASAVVGASLSAAAAGFLLLRRRGVYFSLMTLALSALAFTVAFRWTEVTGGEDGLGGFERGSLGPVSLDDPLAWYVLVALAGFCVLWFCLRLARSPVGHVLVAIRERHERVAFQGYPVDRYRLLAFVLSAAITALAGALSAFQHYLVTAETVSVGFSGELLAMVVIGGMHHFLGPALGAVFYVLFRELLSIWTENWLLWFGLVFVAFVLFSPEGLAGIGQRLRSRFFPAPVRAAAMDGRRIHRGLAVPSFLVRPRHARTILEVEGASKRFGGIRAVDGVSLEVRGDEIHALIGPNGAGKTTLFDLVSGRLAPDAGIVRLQGRAITAFSPDAVCRAGIARSFQITRLFPRLSVYENLRLSVQARHPARFSLLRDVADIAEIHEETRALVRWLGLEGVEEAAAGDLSYGGQRLVDLGIALASAPALLLLDEPFAGLAAAERERVAGIVAELGRVLPVLVVEHDLDRVLALARRVTVMNEGRVLVTGTPEEVRNDPRVQAIYTGSGEYRSRPCARAASSGGPVLLEARGVRAFYGNSLILDGVDLALHEGEIVAVLGRNGAGKSTLLKTIAGLLPAREGSIRFAGRELRDLPAPEIARLGIGYVPQGRGLFPGMSVRHNLELGRLARPHAGETGAVWREEEVLALFPRLRERWDTPADYLSGGEQQMVAIARALSGDVRLLLLDEPFEGLAPAVVEELVGIVDGLRDRVAILLVDHDLDHALALADRVLVLERGRVLYSGPARPLVDDLALRRKILWL